MKLLAIETATHEGGVAVFLDEVILSKRTWSHHAAHSELSTASIEQCMNEAKMNLADLDLITLDLGPGSFTGLRVAVNIGRALSFALGIPLLGLDSHCIMAMAVPGSSQPLLVVQNAFKNLVFVSRYTFNDLNQEWQRVEGLTVEDLSEFERRLQQPHLVVGDGYELFFSHLSPQHQQNAIRIAGVSDYPSVELLGPLSIKHQNLKTQDWKLIKPLYIRASEAEERLRAGFIKPAIKN